MTGKGETSANKHQIQSSLPFGPGENSGIKSKFGNCSKHGKQRELTEIARYLSSTITDTDVSLPLPPGKAPVILQL